MPDSPRLGAPAVPPVTRMVNPVRDYDWGSTSVLAHLQGREPHGGPEAELWMGAHPSSPSALVTGPDAAARPLPDAVAGDPAAVLGDAAVARFGPRLPFMLKVLAVERPLSLQVHPDAARALAVHDPAGGSPYVDAFAKPELIVAVEELSAIFGFRPAAEAARLLGSLGTPQATALAADLSAALEAGEGDEAALRAAFRRLVTWPADDVPALVAAAATAVAGLPANTAGDPVPAEAHRWVGRLAELHPHDPLVLAPLLLGMIRLAPGEAVFVPAGVPHAYLSGTGVEILAASDNVVRAGLTTKRVDVAELLTIVDSRPGAEPLTPAVDLGGGEVAWQPPVPDFRLTHVRVSGTARPAPEVGGPQILLCLRGAVTVRAGGAEVALRGGESAFVTAAAGPLELSGDGEVFRAACGVLL
jgi:mannose-6-phosphate isomerase